MNSKLVWICHHAGLWRTVVTIVVYVGTSINDALPADVKETLK